MGYQELPTGKNPPHEVIALIEIPKGEGEIKYEFDKASEFMEVDRVRHTPMQYPDNYGLIPHTLSEDGDALDILVLGEKKFAKLSFVHVRPIAVLFMEDEKGPDEKIISVPVDSVDSSFSDIKDIQDLKPSQKEILEHFFTEYKKLDGKGKWSKIKGWGDVNEAHRIITESITRHDSKNGPPSWRQAPASSAPPPPPTL